jgi:4a-hydroxytetrahydrobiopterin dehydratase
MGLTEKQCVPCQGGIGPLNLDQATQLLEQVPGWKLHDNASKILREYGFGNFRKALLFVNKVGELAETEKHHPDISFGWGYVRIELQTHAIKGLHENDFILAAKINALGN